MRELHAHQCGSTEKGGSVMIEIKVPSQAARNFLAAMGSTFAGLHGDSHAGAVVRLAMSDLLMHAQIESMSVLPPGMVIQCDPIPSAIGALD